MPSRWLARLVSAEVRRLTAAVVTEPDRRDAASPARAGGVAHAQTPKGATVEYPTEKCRTCQAPIIWAVTERDKDMPVDAQPSAKGNVALSVEGGKVRARVVPAHLAFGRKDLRLSHFVLCPDAPKWRQRP